MSARVKPAWRSWAIGGVSLLWNAIGAYDYTMTNMRDAQYVAQFLPETINYLDAMPLWAMAAWAFGVWGALLGSILLLLRSRFAVHAFAISLAGLAVSTVRQRLGGVPPAPVALTIAIWAAAVFLVWYAGRMRRTGVLR